MERWVAYDPSWLEEELSSHGHVELAGAAASCTSASVYRVMTYFVDPREPNAPGSQWQHERSVMIPDSRYGQIVVDVLVGGRIGAVEFVDRVRS